MGNVVEGSSAPVDRTSGQSTRRRPNWPSIVVLLGILGVVLVLIVASLPPSKASQKIVEGTDGFRTGDYFIYDATGRYNGTEITGSYNLTLYGVGKGVKGGYQGLSTNLPELDSMINAQAGLSLMRSSGQEIGVGRINTIFGIKEIEQRFDGHDGWAAVYYVGSDPQVAYGCAVNGPNFHLSLMLKQTNNPFATANNTSPIAFTSPDETRSRTGLTYYYEDVKTIAWNTFYFSKGALMHFNLTATDTNLYAFSQANMLSMAENGPYACDLSVTRQHVANITGDVVLPSGYYVIILCGHAAPSSMGSFGYEVSAY